MRLLKILPNGDFCPTEKFLDNAVPRYAILSHRWDEDGQEVTFEDMFEGSGQGKAGYEKIKFCGKQAAIDGLEYIWVDSCCIKKLSDSELSESLNSMFRWYRRAQKCYVYLSDVPTTKRKRGDDITPNTWEQAFRKSQWFTRGWTLQELLAPRSVEFFTRDGKRLGDKQSLEQHIHQITGIPISALQGSALSQFDTEQKFDWAKNRQITREEDWAYSLLGIFEISMSVIYGEGKTNAVRRLKQTIDHASKGKECLQHLRVTDPRHDKIRIEETRGGLIADSYHWILENCDFKRWRDDQQSHLLWIKGDPGKGKTMLLCGIIDELKKSTAETHCLSFFYCQATDSRINNATAVLRGLLYLLINQQPSLVLHIQKYYDHAGKTLFEDTNAWVALSDIFTNVLQDPSLKSAYLIIDALDECTIDLPKLLDFIIQKSSVSLHVKWLVSSRNWPPIEERLDKAQNKIRLCLELNAESVSAAVSTFIRHKVCQLAQKKTYNDNT
jgi:NACHT domain/Heterokaryon incompatibility protein (HET)